MNALKTGSAVATSANAFSAPGTTLTRTRHVVDSAFHLVSEMVHQPAGDRAQFEKEKLITIGKVITETFLFFAKYRSHEYACGAS